MKVQMIHNGKSIWVELNDKQIEELFTEENKKTGYDKVKDGEMYYYIDTMKEVYDCRELDCVSDHILYDVANYYSDKTVAKNMARAQRLWNQIHRRSVELCQPVKMNSVSSMYQIAFNSLDKIIKPLERLDTRSFGTVWFDTKEHCQQVIDEFHDELMWYFTEFKDRADM